MEPGGEIVAESGQKIMPPSGSNNCDTSVNRRMALNDTKAGMQGLDVDKINQIIMESSKGSKFYVHQQKAQEKLNHRINAIRQSFENLSAAQIEKSTSQMDILARKLEENRNLSRTIIHVDMDAFFAAVEMRDNPDLRNKPMAVGGDSMLSTSNYLARRFGVRAAMPGFMGKRLCPELIIVPCNYEKYTKVSHEVQEIFKEYDRNFSSVSLDEAYLDITDYLEEINILKPDVKALSPQEVTNEIREKIFLKTGLTASAGIAANSLLAKICGDINKPNGQYYLEPCIEVIREFINKLPIRKVSGIGNVTEQMLNGLNIYTCKDLWDNRGIINLLFKPSTTSFLLEVSMGIGSSNFCFDISESRKSISSERTFYGGGKNVEPQICHDICMELEKDLQARDLKVRSVTLKIKTVDFEVKTRNVNLLNYTNDADIIFETAWGIYKSYQKEIKNLSIRLIGVRLSNFESTSEDATDAQNTGLHDGPLRVLRQKRIDHLLMKIKETESMDESDLLKHECPICNTKFKFYKQLEDHVDQCLSSQQPSSSTTVSPISQKAEEPCPSTSSNSTGNENPLPPIEDEPFLSETSKCPTCSNAFQSKTEREIREYFDHMDLCRLYSEKHVTNNNQKLPLNKTDTKELASNSPPRKRQKRDKSANSRKITDYMTNFTQSNKNQ